MRERVTEHPTSKVMPGQFAKLKLENPTTSPIGYKFKTNSPMKYSVKPVIGVVPAGETIKISGKKKICLPFNRHEY
ncbi:hypothetical protein BGZ83_008186 [Gryganskiella cystojenkinii]|nr:hypothetical protein BGZ83_008186 [Gryganskiella cystojenkinii]